MELEIPSWEDIDVFTRKLAQKIIQGNGNFNAIVSIERGGACLSRLLSDVLAIPIIYRITVKYYDDIQEKKESPIITQALSSNITGQDILVCDDVSDSGNSLKVVKKHLEKQEFSSITTATLYIKPWTSFIPTFYVKETEAWIVFPWEVFETLDKLTQKYMNSGTLEEVKTKLLSAGFEMDLVDFYFSIRGLGKKSKG